MKVAAIALQDFRGIPNLRLDFDPHMTVIVGKNGLGKSSVLDALALMLFQVRNAWNSERTKVNFPPGSIKRGDVRFGKDDYKITLDFNIEDAIGTEVTLSFDLRYSEETFFRSSGSYEKVRSFVLNQTLDSGKDDLLLYYRQDRGFDDDRSTTLRKNGELTSLFGSLKAISQLENWWDRRDAEEARHVRDKDRNYRDPQLEAVRALVKEIDGFIGLDYSSSAEPEGLYFRRNDGASIHISWLSSGERSFIILLADLARRLQLSKPNSRLEDIPAIILIDEIELNLHPSWQSKIVSTLSRVFKSCQFVVTTHSPQVLSSVESKCVRILQRQGSDIQVRRPHRTKGQTSNYLLEGVFQAHERFPEADELIDQFNAAIDAKDLNAAEALFEQIVAEIEGDPPELVVYRKRLNGLRSAK